MSAARRHTIVPPCKEIFPWLVENVGKSRVAELTGTDVTALAAAVHIIRLIQRSPNAMGQMLGLAFKTTVECMQPSSQWAAYHAIAWAMDWDDRSRCWQAWVGDRPVGVPICMHGPESRSIGFPKP